MSDPIRYTGKTEGSLLGSPHWEHPEGEWVKWQDYARLKAEVERLRASSFVTAVPVEEYEKLKAEVERLRKAGEFPFYGGNKLIVDLNTLLTAHRHYCDVNAIDYSQMEKNALNAAKRGNQP